VPKRLLGLPDPRVQTHVGIALGYLLVFLWTQVQKIKEQVDEPSDERHDTQHAESHSLAIPINK
jgi:hypothetical protein